MKHNLGELINNFIDEANKEEYESSLWVEEPVTLYKFFTREDFLNETPYPGKQTELLNVVNEILWWKLTGDKKLCKEDLRNITELIGMFGKGSGKDFLASGILAYVCYLICCMKDPHDYFNFGYDENIDFINVAINAKQAKNVFFKKLKARFSSCKWFERVSYNPSETPGCPYNCYQTTQDQIRLHKNITCYSAHSEADSFEGYNPLVVIFDEIGGYEYDAAENAYSTLRSSSVSRYNDKMFLIFISFPRSSEDFMMKKYNEYLDHKDKPGNQVWGMIGKSWEVNPRIKRESLQKDYDRNPEDAQTKYECIPPKYHDGLFKFPERIDNCIQTGKFSQIPELIVQEQITERYINTGEAKIFTGLELFNLRLNPDFTYYLGGDAGTTTDSYIITLFHAEPVFIKEVCNGVEEERLFNKPVEDLILEWRPSKKDRLPVDLLNVADILETICSQVYVKKALFDKFNSAECVQRLISYGVDAEDKDFSNPFQLQIYQNAKSLIYTGLVELLDYKSPYEELYKKVISPNEELKAIKIINGKKIDHDKDKTKDFSDARASAIWICSTDEPAELTNFSMPTIQGASVGGNLNKPKSLKKLMMKGKRKKKY